MKKIYIDEQGRVYEGDLADLFKEADGIISEVNKINQDLGRNKTKGGNRMNKVFKKSTKEVELDKRDSKIKRQAKVIKTVVDMSVKGTLEDPWTYAAVASVGLNQGLKYKGDFKAGAKAGLATVAVVMGFNIVGNIIVNKDVIKEA